MLYLSPMSLSLSLMYLGSAVRALTYSHTETEGSEGPENMKYSLFAHQETDVEDDYSLLSRGTPLKKIIDRVC